MEMKISLTKKISGVLYECSDFSNNKLNKLTDKPTTQEHIETDDELRRALSLNFVSLVKLAKKLKILKKKNIVKIKKNQTQDCRESRQALPEGCKVNASNHQKLIPVKEFLLSHLPSRYQHVEMWNLIQSLVDITVKLEVSGMSEERKKFKTNKQSLEMVLNQTQVKGVSKNVDDESNSSNTMSVFAANDVAFGSGKVDDVFIRTDRDGPCPCPKQCPECGEIRVFTSAQLMYDDDDAKHFLCTFFYDDDEQVDQLKYARGDRIVLRDLEKDLCMFICVTCDVELIRKLEGMLDKFEQSWEDAFDRYAGSLKWKNERLTVIVSHPYGLKKHIALGKTSEVGDSERGIHYDTPTCEGSVGAYVLIPDFDVKDEV